MQPTRPELWGRFGMVSSTHWLATAAGMRMLELGGNAVDAAVAAGFALQVAEPHLCGPGGDMSLLVAGPDGPPTVLCGQGVAPAGATGKHYLDLGLTMVPGSGPLAAAVPGATPAWLQLARDRGSRTLAELLAPAIGLAEDGVPVLPTMHRAMSGVRDLFRDHWTTSAATWLDRGEAPLAGSVLRNPVLAATYRRLVDAGRSAPSREAACDAALAAWSQGYVAEAIDQFAHHPQLDSSGRAHSGVITGQDLADWRPSYENPVTAQFGDWTITKTPPWGQGPVLLQQLRMLDLLGVSDPRDVESVHRTIEVAKLAFADRDAWFGDSTDVPLATLLSEDYLRGRIGLVGTAASYDLRPGYPDGRSPMLPNFTSLPATGQQAGLGEPTVGRVAGPPASGPPTRSAGADLTEPGLDQLGRTRGDTCHVDVVDHWGATVAAMPSGGWLQSSPVVPGLGFPLGTRLQMMTLQPGFPASLTPGRRPRTTLSPSMAMREGRVELAFGSPGGDQQDQWQLWFFLRVAAGRSLQEAMDAPQLHLEHAPSSFYPRLAEPGVVFLESRWDSSLQTALAERGHLLRPVGPWSLGRMCAVRRTPDGILRAAADPRGAQAYAAGR